MSKEDFNAVTDLSNSTVVLRKKRHSSGTENSPNIRKLSDKPTPTIIPLRKSSSKSEDSLDSGIYSRKKSFDSMDSLDSNESGLNGDGVASQFSGVSPTEETMPFIGSHQYEDYIRECNDIRQSVYIKSNEDEKQQISRPDSGDDQDDDNEAEWLRMAGLSDLVISPDSSMVSTDPHSRTSPHSSSDALSSMTVLSTLTRPQREAVLRRITSFNRAQKTKKRPKPTISSIFPNIDTSPKSSPSEPVGPPPPPEIKIKKPDDLPLKSMSLPREGYEGLPYPRRHSESVRPRGLSGADSPDGLFKSDYRFRNKKNVESIVATNVPGGIETLSISTKRLTPSWDGSRETLSMQFADESGKNEKGMSYTETAGEENLPNFSLVRDRLGITQISDLSPIDMRKVQSLALIELSALFDLKCIDLKRRKLGKNKLKEPGIFGTPITMLVEWDKKRSNRDDIRVPLVLYEIISFLEKNALQAEGILRKSGSAARIKILKQDIEARFGFNESPDESPPSASDVWSDANPNDVAALLKQFLRELPDPLLSTEYIDAFRSCGLFSDRKEQLQALNLLIILLNEVHRDSLKLLLKFLSQVVANEKWNKMSLNNVAMITAPNLFISGRKSKKENSTSHDLKHAAETSIIVRMLIKYHKLLWTVPAFMLTQVRHMNTADMSSKKNNSSKEKYRMKFFQGKKDTAKKLTIVQADPQPFDYETPKGLIRIQAPNMNLTSMAVQLDAQLIASDIIAKYQRQCERMRHSSNDSTEEVNNSTHALYEVGGNIHERRVDPDTNMSMLLRVNPEATWFIRPRPES